MDRSSMSLEGYNEHWNALSATLTTLLTQTPGTFKPISYEQMYSAVFKCVSHQQAERLHGDLMSRLRSQLMSWKQRLDQTDDDIEYIEEFHKIIGQYFVAISNVVPIFTYMNRQYVEPRLGTTINAEMLSLFIKIISENAIVKLLDILNRYNDVPFSVSPAVMHSLVRNIHALSPKFALLHPRLFGMYLTQFGAPMSESELDEQRENERRLQEQLRIQGFGRGDQSRKRNRGTDDEQQPHHHHPQQFHYYHYESLDKK